MAQNLFQILLYRYRQFGGMKVVRFYVKHGALWPMIKIILRNPFSRESYKTGYKVAAEISGRYICRKYAPMMPVRKAYYAGQELEHGKDKVIWWCWLQGLASAPPIVKACCNSLVHGEWFTVHGYTVKVIDNANWREYVELPDYIVKKWEKGQIPAAHFSDLLRVQLLIKYGGTWIDSTVLCTGVNVNHNDNENLKVSQPSTDCEPVEPLNTQLKQFMDADLFMFQYTQPGSEQWRGISNWFITACRNNEVLMVLRDMLFEYWKDFDCMVDYYIFHQFFSMLRSVYPEEISAMPYGYSMRSLALGYHWGERFDQEKWDRLTANVCFHKLGYNVKREVEEGEGNYYHFILEKFLKG